MTDKLDVVGIGNAMVDAMIPSNKEEVEKNNLNRDSMNLIDEKKFSNSFSTPPIIINSTLFLINDDAKLYAFK